MQSLPLTSVQLTLPSIGVSYMPHKLSRTSEEAKAVAAEYALSQLGYCNEGEDDTQYLVVYT